MLRDDDTRPLRPAGSLRRLTGPNYEIEGIAKSLWVNDVGMVSVVMVAAEDDSHVRINLFGPGLIPVRVKQIICEGTTAKDLIAMHG